MPGRGRGAIGGTMGSREPPNRDWKGDRYAGGYASGRSPKREELSPGFVVSSATERLSPARDVSAELEKRSVERSKCISNARSL